MSEKIAVVNPPMVRKKTNGIPVHGHGVITSTICDLFEISQIDLDRRLRILNGNILRKSTIDISILKDSSKILKYFNGGNYEIERILKKLIDLGELRDYDILCFSVSCHRSLTNLVLPISKLLKKYVKTIVIGGRSVDYNYPKDIADLDFVDYVVCGSGERSLPKIIKNEVEEKDIDLPNEVVTDSKDESDISFYRHPIEEQPYPYFSESIIEKYRYTTPGKEIIIPYQIGRNCKNKCSFCDDFIIGDYEYRSIDRVIDDLKEMKNIYGTEKFFLCDTNLFNDVEYIERFSETIISENLDIRWGGLAEICTQDYEFYDKLSRSGCDFLMLGMESGSDSVLERMNKFHNVKEASRTIRLMDKANIKQFIYLITGFPHETETEFEETKRFLRKHSDCNIIPCINTFWLKKKSPIYRNPNKFGIKVRDELDDYNSKLDKIIMKENHEDKLIKFDEINGLKWEDKRISQRRKEKELSRVVRNLRIKNRLKNFPKSLSAFLKYYFMEKREYYSTLYRF